MISKKMRDALNAQINAEFWSAYLYLSMSLDAENKGLKGIAHWFHKQYEEENEHAFKFIHYLQEQLSDVELKAVAKVQLKWESALGMFKDTLSHEKEVTKMIHKLFELAQEEKDYATAGFLQYFIREQVEEEANAQELIDAMSMVEGDKAAVFMFDGHLAKR